MWRPKPVHIQHTLLYSVTFNNIYGALKDDLGWISSLCLAWSTAYYYLLTLLLPLTFLPFGWIVLYFIALNFPEAGFLAEYSSNIIKRKVVTFPLRPVTFPGLFIVFTLKLVSFVTTPLELEHFRPCILLTNWEFSFLF